MPDTVVVVFLYPTQPPAAFVTTRADLVDQARDLAAQTATHPGRAPAMGFDEAWCVLAQDKKAAFHYADVESARFNILHGKQFTLHERTTLLSSLDRLALSTQAATGGAYS